MPIHTSVPKYIPGHRAGKTACVVTRPRSLQLTAGTSARWQAPLPLSTYRTFQTLPAQIPSTLSPRTWKQLGPPHCVVLFLLSPEQGV